MTRRVDAQALYHQHTSVFIAPWQATQVPEITPTHPGFYSSIYYTCFP